MQRIWFHAGILGVLLSILAGCKTSPPDLKPATLPEQYNVPPSEARFNSPNYPKEALARDDSRRLRDTTAGMPKGALGPGGMGGSSMGMNNGMR